MRFFKVAGAVLVLLVMLATPVWADLQSVSVGGQIRVRGNYWRNAFNTRSAPALVGNNIRWSSDAFWGRPIGDPVGGQTIISFFDWDNAGKDYAVIEQRTRLHLRADFTKHVAMVAEFDAFSVWGETFRSNYLTGADRRDGESDHIQLHQGYVEVAEAWGLPVRIRVGRQELFFGKGWLTGNNDALPEFAGLSFDAVRLTYTPGALTLDAFWSKLVERMAVEEDGDTDFAGVYASYAVSDALTLDAYWFWVRDAAHLEDTEDSFLGDWTESLFGRDDYGTTQLHTLGMRLAGASGKLDYDLESAYQFGEADAAGFLFKPFSYGDDEAAFDAWAAETEIGYTLDLSWCPRLFLGAAYFYGEDNRDLSFWGWLNPLTAVKRPESSISFNRMFSNTVHSYFMDEMGELSNFWMVRGGFSVQPAETVEAGMNLALFRVVEPFELPLHFWLNGRRITLARDLSFLTRTADTDIGWELGVWGRYHYSDDLTFEAGWSHLFTGNALRDGNFVDLNGLTYNGGTDQKDADYLYFETDIRF